MISTSIYHGLLGLGYSEDIADKIFKDISNNTPLNKIPELKPEDYEVFACSLSSNIGNPVISPSGHIKMLAAVQPYISGAISKTINLPNNISKDEVKKIIMDSWTMGIKCITLYRDGCKLMQPIEVTKSKEIQSENHGRTKLPKNRIGITHKFSISGLDGYLTINLYPNGKPGEIFIRISKSGSTLQGLISGISILTSLCLQYNIPIEVISDKFVGTKFDPQGLTNNKDIPFAKSILDYVFRYLQKYFPSSIQGKSDISLSVKDLYEMLEHIRIDTKVKEDTSNTHNHTTGEGLQAITSNRFEGELCPNCHNASLVPHGTCSVCTICGETAGCS